MEFQLEKLEEADERTLAVLAIQLISNGGAIGEPFPAVVDSATDLSIFPLDQLVKVGVDFSKAKMIDTVTSAGEGESLMGTPPMIDCYVAGHFVPVTAIGNPNLTFATLGLHDFFRHFQVTFDVANETFTLTPTAACHCTA